jgi:mRNA-degrading endonuclease RelE of RelBE toxin-antitoxin system
VATGSRGKSGGARVIYYYFDEEQPILLITVFSKNEKSDLSARSAAGCRI